MGKYIVKRLLWLLPIMFVISFIAFLLMNITPGDPARMYLSQGGDSPSQEAIDTLREEMGLNNPFFVQYGNWIRNIFKGDFGTSIYTGNPVMKEIVTYFPNTLKLALLSMFLTLLISIPIGILVAVHENKLVDYIIRICTFVAGSLPGFFAAMLMILILGLKLRLLPIISSGNGKGIWMPAITLALTLSASYIRQIRTTVIRELGEDYIRMFKARGITERITLYKGALVSVLPSILTIAGMTFGRQLGGTAIIEMVCTYQGMGRLAIESITKRDYPLMQGYVFMMAAIYVLVNLVVDVLHAYADPRVKQRFIIEGRGKLNFGNINKTA